MSNAIVQGKFADMLPLFEGQHNQHSGLQTVSFLHIDCNLHSSTMDVLLNLNGRIKRGTVIVFDELINCEPPMHQGDTTGEPILGICMASSSSGQVSVEDQSCDMFVSLNDENDKALFMVLMATECSNLHRFGNP